MNRKLFIISLILFVNVAGYGLILPLLPFLAANLKASPLIIGLFISVFHLFAMLSGPFLGELADKFGRKPVLLFSTGGTVISFLLLGTAKTIPLLFLARIIDGISAGNSSTARAVITDITPKDKRISKLGFTFAAESLGLIAGPLIGGYFAQYGFTVSAYMAAAIAALAFIFTLFLLPETKNFEDKSSAFGKKGAVNFNEMFKALKNTKIRIFILAVFIIQFLITVMWGSLALFGKSLFGFTGKEMGYISAFAATVGILSQIVLLNILLKLTKEKIIFTLGLTTMFLGMLCLATSSSVAVLLIGVGLMAMSFNILMPTVTGFVSELSPDEDQGRLMGIISSTTYLGSLAGPVIGNAIYSFSMRGNYLFGATIALLAALSTIKGIKIKRNQKLKIRNYPPGAD